MGAYFSLTITLGNDAMQTQEDVGEALEDVAKVLMENGPVMQADRGTVLDANGNTVGTWRFDQLQRKEELEKQ